MLLANRAVQNLEGVGNPVKSAINGQRRRGTERNLVIEYRMLWYNCIINDKFFLPVFRFVMFEYFVRCAAELAAV